MRDELPRFVLDLVAAVPTAGEGVHGWLFRVARQLHAHRSPDEIVDLLAATVEGCGRAVPLSEIEAAVRNSEAVAWRPGAAPHRARVGTSASNWPEPDPQLRERVVGTGFALADLWESSPVRVDSTGPGTEEIIDRLFPGDPLLCCAKDKTAAFTHPRESLRGGLAALQLIVPNPMRSQHGTTKDGKQSARCLDNTGPRRFIVVEFDTGTTDEHAATLAHLADYAPLALAVHSGGKSLHGWFRSHQDEAVTRRFFAYAVKLGADPATWTRCQFVRMPGGLRDNGARQVVWFFNPEAAHAN